MEDELSIRLRGEGVKPGLIRSKEIAEILEAIEEMAIAEAIKADPTLHRDDIVVGFYAIEDKSIGLRFKTTFTTTVLTAFVSAALAVQNKDFENLTPQSLNSLRLISGFSKKHSCNAIIGTGLSEDLATITPSTVIPSATFILGRTEVLGRVVRVGGKTPKAMIELVDGTTLYCGVPEDIAKELGRRLYSLARFEGYAKWDSKTLDLEDLQIFSVKEFPNNDPREVLREIASLVGNEFEGLGDVIEFVSTLRNDGVAEE
ncbi:MAG: hypothetical protein JAY62_00650 [Candidatus Thiodiazotropha endolucinida]|nr:hypothetical protein [Candidatus Thiodiazotropha taylori]MCW4273605.1 hypothetical protein [Candidatus Thiodiazotropha taylori]